MYTTVTLEIPESIAETYINEHKLRQHLFEDIIIAEFQKGNLSVGESAKLLGFTYESFLGWLGEQKLSFITAEKEELENSYHSFENFMKTYVKP